MSSLLVLSMNVQSRFRGALQYQGRIWACSGKSAEDAQWPVVRLLGWCRTSDQETLIFIPKSMGQSRIRETYLDLGLEVATAVLRLHS
jgi:hypothetical protein